MASGFMASPIALEMAEAKKKAAMTRVLMFFGALVNAYSSPVIEAKISEKAL